MSRFRSKPVEVEAVQMTKQRLFDWINNVEQTPNGLISTYPSFECKTRQGVVTAELNDWLIQESDGSGCYPCKPDVFAAKYEPVDGEKETA